MSPRSAPRPERQARSLLRAFPWRVAAERGDEIVATTLDTLPPGTSRLPLRTAVDLVRGGWRVRRQNRPSLPLRVAYRSGARLNPRWLQWVQDDLDDPSYLRRVRRTMVGSNGVFAAALAVFGGFEAPLVPFALLVLAGTAFGVRRSQLERVRTRLRARHGLGAEGVDPAVVWVRERRRPLLPDAPAAPLLIGTGLAAMALGAAAISVVGHPRPGTVRGPELALGTAMAPADPLRAAGPWILGALAAAVLAALALGASGWIRRGRPVPEPVGPPRLRFASRSVGQLLLALGGLAAVTVLALLWLTWLPWSVAVVLAAAGGVGAVAVLGGTVVAMVGRRRRRPIGVWEVLPRVGPRELEVPLPAWWLASHPDPRWVVVGPAIPA